MKSENLKPIVVHAETKKMLDSAKEVDYEAYDHVIVRALKALEKE